MSKSNDIHPPERTEIIRGSENVMNNVLEFEYKNQNRTYSNSASTVSSYVSIFETLWIEMYEKSQDSLHSAEDELAKMNQYLNEVLDEIATIKKPVEG
jgi:hypothetical protein